MKLINYGLNNVQRAVTMAIVQDMAVNSRKQPRQVWSVPAGYGKSRIIIAVIVALSLANPNFNFLVVYNHRELMDEDKQLLDKMGDLSGTTIKLMVAEQGKQITIADTNQVTIIDEVDNVLIDSACILVKRCKGNPVVLGLTATAKGVLTEHEL